MGHEFQRGEFISQQKEKYNDISVIKEIDAANEEAHDKLRVIIESLLPLPSCPRVIDVGCGTGSLIPHLKTAGVQDILAIDLSGRMLELLQERYATGPILGNEPGVRAWEGDFLALPNYMGLVDAVVMNSVYGCLFPPEEYLIKAVSFLRPGVWYNGLHEKYPEAIPGKLPGQEEWESLLHHLPLEIKIYRDDPELYLTVLEIPEGYGFDGSPVVVEGTVIAGRGIGSAKLGVPTANLDPTAFQEALEGKSKGVYFGWSQLKGTQELYASVFNLGVCPTMKNEEEEVVSLEAHILHLFSGDFYGETLRVALVGYLRPEIKFPDVDTLLSQIQVDIGKAKNVLKTPELLNVKQKILFL